MRTVLIVSHSAPPLEDPGAIRLAATARLLPAHGWTPVALTSTLSGRDGQSPLRSIAVDEPLAFAERRRRKRGGHDPAADVHVSAPSGFKRWALSNVAIPDPHLAWALAGVVRGVRLARAIGADAILSSSPAESAHLLAGAIATLTGTPWVAEFRDGWTVEGLRGSTETPARRRIEQALEGWVGRRADQLIGVTASQTAQLAKSYGGAAFVPNGFDEYTPSREEAQWARQHLDAAEFNLVYTGRFSLSRGTQDPRPVIDALMRLDVRHRVRLVVAGETTAAEAAALGQLDHVSLLGRVPRRMALALQRQADANLLLLTGPDRTVVPAKVYEYLGAARPILAVTGEGETAKLLRETETARPLAPTDGHAITRELERLIEERGGPGPKQRDAVGRFDRRVIVADLAQVLDAVSERTRHPRAG